MEILLKSTDGNDVRYAGVTLCPVPFCQVILVNEPPRLPVTTRNFLFFAGASKKKSTCHCWKREHANICLEKYI